MAIHIKPPLKILGVIFLIWFVYRNVISEPKKVVDYQELLKFEQTRSIALKIFELISQVEVSVFSRAGEDGIIYQLSHLFDLQKEDLFVEIGAGDGSRCNSRYFTIFCSCLLILNLVYSKNIFKDC